MTLQKLQKIFYQIKKLDCVAYGCTSGTVAAGYDLLKKKLI
jgi:maleate cis-trans isomerase